MRTYAHVLREEETDLSFAEFDVAKRRYASPHQTDALKQERDTGVTARRPFENLEHETGFEPATLTLAT